MMLNLLHIYNIVCLTGIGTKPHKH